VKIHIMDSKGEFEWAKCPSGCFHVDPQHIPHFIAHEIIDKDPLLRNHPQAVSIGYDRFVAALASQSLEQEACCKGTLRKFSRRKVFRRKVS